MKNIEIVNKITFAAHKALFKVKKHSPEILITAGVIGTVASAVMACKATTKLSDILEDTVVTIVDKESFPSYLKEHPNKLFVVMESISSRIRAQSNKLAKACKVCADYAEEKETKGYVDSALMNEMKVLAAENKKARH